MSRGGEITGCGDGNVKRFDETALVGCNFRKDGRSHINFGADCLVGMKCLRQTLEAKFFECWIARQ